MEKQTVKKTLVVHYFSKIKCTECGNIYNFIERKKQVLEKKIKCTECGNIIEFEIIDETNETFDPILTIKEKR